MRYIRYALPFALVALLVSPPYMASEAHNEMAEVKISFPGLSLADVELKMNIIEAEKMVEEMERRAEKGGLNAILSFLKGYPNMEKLAFSENNITNYLSFVFGFADGLFVYTADIAFFLFLSLISDDAIFILAMMAFFTLFSHLIPFRFVVPAGIIHVEEGSIKTMGMKGLQEIGDEAFLLGFVGIVVSIFIPSASVTFLPLFIAGYSLAILPNPFG